MSVQSIERYEMVAFVANGKSCRKRLRITRETDAFLTGVYVNVEGDEVSGAAYDEQLNVIQKSAITRRTPLAFDRKTAYLVSAKA